MFASSIESATAFVKVRVARRRYRWQMEGAMLIGRCGDST